MKIRITDPTKDVSLINRAFQQQEETVKDVADLKQQVFTQVNLPIQSGKGAPSGRIAAPVGSLYLRLDGGTSTTLYVKESGGDTTSGWVPK